MGDLGVLLQESRAIASEGLVAEAVARRDFESIKECLADALSNGDRRKSYAGVAKRPAVSGMKKVAGKGPSIAVIYPRNEAEVEDSAKTEQLLKAALDPADDDFKVVRVRKVRKKGVLVETADQKDIERMVEGTLEKKLRAGGLKAEVPPRRGPRILIYDVPREIEVGDLPGMVFAQNLRGSGFDLETFKDQFKPAFQTGPRERPVTNWVVAVSPTIRDRLRAAGRIYIGWGASCRVVDFLGVTRCFRCNAFGHVAAKCHQEVATCGRCAESGHERKACPVKGEPTCANCKRAGKVGRHEVDSRDCPALQYAMRRAFERTDW